VLPGQAAEENGGVVALQLSKGVLDGLVKMMDLPPLKAGLAFEAGALLVEAHADHVFRGENL